jgi:hypothetical protein
VLRLLVAGGRLDSHAGRAPELRRVDWHDPLCACAATRAPAPSRGRAPLLIPSVRARRLADASAVGAFAYFELITFATKHLPSTFVACSIALEPLAVSALCALAYRHYSLSPLEAIGYAVAFLGVSASASPPASPPTTPPAAPPALLLCCSAP